MTLNRNRKTLFLVFALFIALSVNLPRILILFGVTDGIGDFFKNVSALDVIIRFSTLFLFSWSSLLLNTQIFKIKRKSNGMILLGQNLLLLALALFVLIFLYPKLTSTNLVPSQLYFLIFIYSICALLLFLFSRVLLLQMRHQEEMITQERLKQQNLENELMALKNQINPHFLFNALNSFNALISTNTKATQFVNKLSFMYRYILQGADREVVFLHEELKFLESYHFLNKVRYGDKLTLNIAIDDRFLDKKIPTLGLQLLVENAVKHNEISNENPLSIEVYGDTDSIYVSNKIQPRSTWVESTGKGLQNLDKRFYLLCEKHITITNDDNLFKVKLPLIP